MTTEVGAKTFLGVPVETIQSLPADCFAFSTGWREGKGTMPTPRVRDLFILRGNIVHHVIQFGDGDPWPSFIVKE